MKRPYAQLTSTGRTVPTKVVTNHDFAKMGLETSHEWIVERTGIVQRHIAQDGETTCSLAAAAAQTALGRIATADEVASAALFLASDLASGITGQLIRVDAGVA